MNPHNCTPFAGGRAAAAFSYVLHSLNMNIKLFVYRMLINEMIYMLLTRLWH